MRRLRIFLRRTYGGLPGACWLLCLAAFVNRSGAMVMPFASIYLGARFQLSVAEAGRVIALFGIGSIVGSIVGGRLADRIGPVRLQIATLSLTAAWMALLSFVPDCALFAAGMFLLGVFNDAFRPGNVAAVAASCAPYRQTRALTLNRLALNAGWAIGPAVGGVLAGIDFHWLFFVDGGTCALAAILLSATVPAHIGVRARPPARAQAPQSGPPSGPQSAPQSGPAPGLSPWRDLRFLLLLLVSTLCFTAFLQSFQTLSRHLEHALGFPKWLIGVFFTVNPLAIVLFEMPLVHSLQRRSHLHVAAVGAMCVGLAYPWLILQSWGPWAVLCQTLTITIGEMLYMPMLGAWVAHDAPPAARGSYLGAYFASFSVGFVLAPLLGGLVYDEFGADALWIACAAGGLLAAASLRALARPPRGAAVAAAA